jgi:hypothetical protein
MRNEKNYINRELAGHPSIRIASQNDKDGDCGTHVTLQFADRDSARRFEQQLAICGVPCWRLIDSRKHILSNWDAIMNHRGAHHPSRNPHNHPGNRRCSMEYSKTMCPRTTDIPGRTVFVQTHPRDTKPEWGRKLTAILKADEECLQKAD